MRLYAIYGLVFRSEIPLPGAECKAAGDVPCITVERGESRAIPSAPPEGHLLHEESHEDGPTKWFAARPVCCHWRIVRSARAWLAASNC